MEEDPNLGAMMKLYMDVKQETKFLQTGKKATKRTAAAQLISNFIVHVFTRVRAHDNATHVIVERLIFLD